MHFIGTKGKAEQFAIVIKANLIIQAPTTVFSTSSHPLSSNKTGSKPVCRLSLYKIG